MRTTTAGLVYGLLLLGASVAAADPAASTAAVVQLAVIANATCALHADGNVSCWGTNDQHHLGLSDTTLVRAQPIGVPAFRDVVQLEGVFWGVCGRYRDGRVRCLGMTSTSPVTLEVQPLEHVSALRGTCALLEDGHAACFDSKQWSRVPGLDDAIDVSGNGSSGCAVHRNGTVGCWAPTSDIRPALVGAAADGSLADIAGVRDAVQVAVGSSFACARLRDGHVACWGQNDQGELGTGKVDPRSEQFTSATRVAGIGDAVDLLAGAAHACVRRKAGPMACWGNLPWTYQTQSRARVVLPMKSVSAFASGDQTCAVASGRDVWCWGAGGHGELGNGSSLITSARKKADIHDAIQVIASELTTCALRRSGAVVCWGHDHGVKLPAMQRLGLSDASKLVGLDRKGRFWESGETRPHDFPIATREAGPCVIANAKVFCSTNGFGFVRRQIHEVAIDDATELSGPGPICALRAKGSVACITDGEVTPIPGIDDAIAIGSGNGTACVVRADRTVWCKEAHAPTATAVPGVGDAASVAIGRAVDAKERAQCVVMHDGSVSCWGANDHGQLGTGDATPRSGPQHVGGVKDATQVTVGWHHACALDASGGVTCWGSTEYGQSGTPPTERVQHPVAVVWP